MGALALAFACCGPPREIPPREGFEGNTMLDGRIADVTTLEAGARDGGWWNGEGAPPPPPERGLPARAAGAAVEHSVPTHALDASNEGREASVHDSGAVGGEGGYGQEAGRSAGPDMTGWYAGKVSSRSLQTVGTLGTIRVLSTVFGVAQVHADPSTGQLSMWQSGCHMEVVGEATGLLEGITFEVPDPVVRGTRFDWVALTLAKVGSAYHWRTGVFDAAVGWARTDHGEAIPTAASDQRVVDADGDGHPGVSIRVGGLLNTEIYVAQRQRFALEGDATEAARMVASNVDTSEQVVLGSASLLLTGVDIAVRKDVDSSDDVAVLVRTADRLSCDDLRAQAGTLFQ